MTAFYLVKGENLKLIKNRVRHNFFIYNSRKIFSISWEMRGVLCAQSKSYKSTDLAKKQESRFLWKMREQEQRRRQRTYSSPMIIRKNNKWPIKRAKKPPPPAKLFSDSFSRDGAAPRTIAIYSTGHFAIPAPAPLLFLHALEDDDGSGGVYGRILLRSNFLRPAVLSLSLSLSVFFPASGGLHPDYTALALRSYRYYAFCAAFEIRSDVG